MSGGKCRGGNYPWGICPSLHQKPYFWGVYVRWVSVLVGKCPGVKCPVGKCPVGKCPGGKCPGGKCSGGKCPRVSVWGVIVLGVFVLGVFILGVHVWRGGVGGYVLKPMKNIVFTVPIWHLCYR